MFQLIFLLLIAYTYGLKNLDEEAGPVVYLSMIYRHGDRTPRSSIVKKFSQDNNLKIENFPEGWGQLTLLGKQQQYYLGQWLRRRYIHLLPNENYKPETICAKSSHKDRALNSALTNLAGMFPPGSNEFVKGLNWQPIPVRYMSKGQDKLINMDVYCKNYDGAVKEFEKSPAALEIQQRYRGVFNKIGIKNENVNSLKIIQDLYSLLLIEETRNLTLDRIYDGIYPNKLKEASDFSFILPTYTDYMKRLISGPILSEMIDNMHKSSKNLLKFCVNITSYSAHDGSMANLMNTIGIFNNKLPPYASVLLVELRKKENQHFVTTLYKNETDDSVPYLLSIPGCETPCNFKTFINIMKKYMPQNWEEECNSTKK